MQFRNYNRRVMVNFDDKGYRRLMALANAYGVRPSTLIRQWMEQAGPALEGVAAAMRRAASGEMDAAVKELKAVSKEAGAQLRGEVEQLEMLVPPKARRKKKAPRH